MEQEESSACRQIQIRSIRTPESTSKPRKGVGVSADMFVTPFIMLGGTMNSPRLALDKTGILVSGGAAVLTGGLSFLVQGAADRATGAQDRCAAALALAKGEKIEVTE